MDAKKPTLEDRFAERLEKVMEECLKTNEILRRMESMCQQSLQRLKCKEYSKNEMIHGMVYFRRMLDFLEDLELSLAKIEDDKTDAADSDLWERSTIYKSTETLHNHRCTSSVKPPYDYDNEGSQLPSTNWVVDVSQCKNLTDKLPVLHPEVITYDVQNSSIQNQKSQQELFKDISLLDCLLSDLPAGTKFSYEKAISEMYNTSVPPASDDTNSRLIENGTTDTSEEDVICEKPVLSSEINEMTYDKAVAPDEPVAPEEAVALEKAIISKKNVKSKKATALEKAITSEKAKEKTITTVIAAVPNVPVTTVATVVPKNSITVSNKNIKRAQQKKGKFVKNIENVKTNTNESQKHLELKNKPLDSDASISAAIKKVEHGEEYQLPAQQVLKTKTRYNCILTWVETPEEIFICDRPNDLERMVEEMAASYSDNRNLIKFKSADLLDSGKYYACFNSSAWFRCMITSFNVENNPSLLEVYLIDIGKSNILTSYLNLKPLMPQFCKMPALSRACHLVNLKPPVDGGGTWPSEAIAYLKELIEKECVFYLLDNMSETLGVIISINEEPINCYFLEQNWASEIVSGEGFGIEEEEVLPMGTMEEYNDSLLADQGDINKDEIDICKHYKGPPATTCFKGKKCPKRHELIHPGFIVEEEEEVPPMGTTEEYNDPLMAVQGYINRDEIDICKHYKGPPATTCFKGKKCPKRHELIHPDGWTKDKRPIIKATVQDMSYPDAGSEIDVLVTFIKSDKMFIGQILQRNIPTGHTKAQLYPKTIDRLIESMNPTESSDNKYVYYTEHPARGELLEAKYPLDNYWYRAKVTGFVNDEVEVCFVDYGNSIRADYRSLRHIDENHLFLPIQGVLFSIGNITPPEQALKDEDSFSAYRSVCEEILKEELLNKIISVTVLSSTEGNLSVIINGNGSRVIETLRISCHTVVTKHVHLQLPLARQAISYMPG